MNQKLHPIQLQSIRVKELFLKVYDPNRAQESDLDLDFTFKVGHSEFNAKDNQIAVGVFGCVGHEINEGNGEETSGVTPFVIKADLIGQFSIDTSLFPVDKIDKWAKENAPLILLPFFARTHLRIGI